MSDLVRLLGSRVEDRDPGTQLKETRENAASLD